MVWWWLRYFLYRTMSNMLKPGWALVFLFQIYLLIKNIQNTFYVYNFSMFRCSASLISSLITIYRVPA